jgi:hypothetical protein
MAMAFLPVLRDAAPPGHINGPAINIAARYIAGGLSTQTLAVPWRGRLAGAPAVTLSTDAYHRGAGRHGHTGGVQG